MMLKLAVVVALVGLLAGPSPAIGGMLPGSKHYQLSFFIYLYRKASEACYGKDFDWDNELALRESFANCYMRAAHHDEKEAEEAAFRKRRSLGLDLEGEEEDQFFVKDTAPFYSADVVRALKNDVLNNVRVVQCVLDSFNFTITENGTVDATSLIKTYTNNQAIPADVKGYLVDGVKECEANSNQGSFKIWGQKYADFFKLLKFFRCSDGHKIFACMKADYKRDAAMFDLSGLDGELNDVDDIAKMYFISSSYSNWDRTGIFDVE